MDEKKPVLFVVDDDPIMRRLLSQLFQEKYAVTALDSAYQALEKLAQYTPDIILSDIKMPGKDGLSLATDIAKSHPEIPIILLTGYGNKEIAINAIKLGVFDFVEKPFINCEIRIAVDRAAQFSNLIKNNSAYVRQLRKGAMNMLRSAKRETVLLKEISWLKKLVDLNSPSETQ